MINYGTPIVNNYQNVHKNIYNSESLRLFLPLFVEVIAFFFSEKQFFLLLEWIFSLVLFHMQRIVCNLLHRKMKTFLKFKRFGFDIKF